MKGTALIEYFGNGMYRYIDSDGIEHILREPVKCKDCKYWNKHHLVDIYVCSIHNKEGQYPYLLFEMNADDFCSRGEKKDE